MRDELFEAFPFGIIRLNKDGQIQRINSFARQLIQTLDAETSEWLLKLTPADDLSAWSGTRLVWNIEIYEVPT
jgi:c-di-AMP phosphodiesterase-like protein